MTKPTKKKKFTLADLKPVQTRIEIAHPTHGDVGCWIDVNPPQSIEYMEAVMKLGEVKLDELSLQERLVRSAELPASVVIGWNEDFFGMECNKENVVSVLSDIQNSWILYTLNAELAKPENFYKK